MKIEYEKLIKLTSLNSYSIEEALNIIADLVNSSNDLMQIDGLNLALKLIEETENRCKNSQYLATLYYFCANAWSGIKVINHQNKNNIWLWEQIEIKKEIYYLRKSINENGFNDLEIEYKLMIFTNLGSVYSHIGRSIEAIECFNKVLNLYPFCMALGNKAIALFTYAKHLYDDGHQSYFLYFTYKNLKNALKNKDLNCYYEAINEFKQYINWIEKNIDNDFLNSDLNLNEFSNGESEEEIEYREWCLSKTLFLNPLNDLGNYSIANNDIIHLPNMIINKEKLSKLPSYLGLYNQLKQEFTSMRFLLYESLFDENKKYADNDIQLIDTLDYPIYALSIEKLKISYRGFYSLFDKIAFFMNDYFNLNIKSYQVSFRTIWYEKINQKMVLKNFFNNFENLPMRALFYLSKDFYDKSDDFHDVIEPEAKELAIIRNHLEHKYLKVHDSLYYISKNLEFDISNDKLAYSITVDNLKAKTLKISKLARSALIYLSLAINIEERKKENESLAMDINYPEYKM